jgi:hypothetical protein
MRLELLLIGSTLFLIAQILRAVRWQLLLPNDFQTSKRNLLLYTSLGGFINLLVPFKLGDLMRAYIFSKQESANFGFSFASIATERFTDALVVLFVLFGMHLFYDIHFDINFYEILYAISAIILIVALISRNRYFRKFIFSFSSIWNKEIQFLVLDFFRSLVIQFTSKRFMSLRYILISQFMWLFYASSYYIFYLYIKSKSFLDVWNIFHGSYVNSIFQNFQLDQSFYSIVGGVILFFLMPLAVVIVYNVLISTISKKTPVSSLIFRLISQSGVYGSFGVPTAFATRHAYENFLLSYFTSNQGLMSQVGNIGFNDSKIIRTYAGSSGAVTALISRGDEFRIRKVISNHLSHKLKDQYNWLLKTKTKLPLVKVYEFIETPDFSYYEMPYETGSVDFYEWLHTGQIDHVRNILLDLANILSEHHRNNLKKKNSALLDSYIIEKIHQNINKISEIVSSLVDVYEFKINGEVYSLREWDFLLNSELIKKVITDTLQTDIHGDLTLENIIISPAHKIFIIDPNPSTIYKTGLMDWGKLLQSLHMGYEFLSRNSKCSYDKKNINYFLSKSTRYEDFYQIVTQEIIDRFGMLGYREARFHEIIHYLRLVPYKFDQSTESGLLFFAVTCQVIREYQNTFKNA